MDLADAYRSIRGRLVDLAADLTEEESTLTVLATPAWDVRDTFAHLVGAIDDVLTGTLEGYGTEAWTAAHVTSRTGDTLKTICAEWSRRAPDFEQLLDSTANTYAPLIAGTWTHEQDIRGSLGLKGVGDTGGMELTLDLVDDIGGRIDSAGEGALRIRAGGRVWTLGSSEVAATLDTSPYVLARLVYGRRSAAQIAALDWEGDPTPYLALIGRYDLAQTEIDD